MKPKVADEEKPAVEQPIIKEPEPESETKDDSESPSSDWSKLADPISKPAEEE